MSEARKPEPKEGVRPPGETLWLAHAAVFGSLVSSWDELGLISKVRWAHVEATAFENLMAQGTPPDHSPAGKGKGL